MKSICLYFQIHHPLKLKKYRFFNMGNDSFYLDEYLNKSTIMQAASSCYIPANKILLDKLIQCKGDFKVSFSISGTAIELFKTYTPEVLQSFKELAATGYVDFLVEPYAHSLSSLVSKEEFISQVKRHAQLIEDEFGIVPTTFANTELIYSSGIGEMVAEIGYTNIVTEGAKHILGWKSPGFVYADSINPKIKLLLRNSSLCDDLRYRFGNESWDQWPLTTSKYIDWIKGCDGDVANIFIDYEVFGCNNNVESGIFDFLESLPTDAIESDIEFKFAKDIVEEFQAVGALGIGDPISWADEERDITPWFGNEIQKEAISQLYSIRDKVKALDDENINYVWNFMQSSNHFYYMSTKVNVVEANANVNPYDSPYEAFMNYMNVCSDFKRDVEERYELFTAPAEQVVAPKAKEVAPKAKEVAPKKATVKKSATTAKAKDSAAVKAKVAAAKAKAANIKAKDAARVKAATEKAKEAAKIKVAKAKEAAKAKVAAAKAKAMAGIKKSKDM